MCHAWFGCYGVVCGQSDLVRSFENNADFTAPFYDKCSPVRNCGTHESLLEPCQSIVWIHRMKMNHIAMHDLASGVVCGQSDLVRSFENNADIAAPIFDKKQPHKELQHP